MCSPEVFEFCFSGFQEKKKVKLSFLSDGVPDIPPSWEQQKATHSLFPNYSELGDYLRYFFNGCTSVIPATQKATAGEQ